MNNCVFCEAERLPDVAQCPNCHQYVPACVKCGEDVLPGELATAETDTNLGTVSFYIHEDCLMKPKIKKIKHA